MGVGNYSVENGKTVQVSNSQIYGEYITGDEFENSECGLDYQVYYGEFIEHVRELMPENYEAIDTHDRYTSARTIAENSFFTIQVQPWEGYVAISVVVKEDEGYTEGVHPLAVHHLDARAKTVFDKLATCYNLRVSCGAWCSGSYEISKVA